LTRSGTGANTTCTYIDNRSIWLDFLTIAKIVMVLFRDEKAY